MPPRFAARLALSFSPKRLLGDLKRCEAFFSPYQNPLNQGEVYVAPLLSPGGERSALSHCPGFLPFAPTPALERAAYFSQVLGSLPCPKLSARLIRIPAGHGLVSHRDNWRGFRYGILRLHIPVLTRPGVALRIGDERFYWRPGEVWYGDFSEEHEVFNASRGPRVHLVVDVQITRDLLRIFPASFLAKARRKGVTLAPRTLSLPRERLKRFECRFDLPPGFLPSTREIRCSATKTRIRLTKSGELRLQAAGYGSLRLAPINNNTLIPVGVGAGSLFRFSRGPRAKAAVEIMAHGVLHRDAFSAQVKVVDLQHRAPRQSL